MVEQGLQTFHAFGLAQTREIRALGLADHLDALVGEIPEEAREGQSGTVHHRFGHQMVKPRIHHHRELETLQPRRDELAQGELGGDRRLGNLDHTDAMPPISCGRTPCAPRARCPCAPSRAS